MIDLKKETDIFIVCCLIIASILFIIADFINGKFSLFTLFFLILLVIGIILLIKKVKQK